MSPSYNNFRIEATKIKITIAKNVIFWFNETYVLLKGVSDMSPIFEGCIDFVASEEVIDLYFIYSDLAEIEFSETELYETAQYDALSNSITCEQASERYVPLGKLVL